MDPFVIYVLFVFVMLSLQPCGLLCVMFSCVIVAFPCGVLGQVWYFILSISDLCLLFNFCPFLVGGSVVIDSLVIVAFSICLITQQ